MITTYIDGTSIGSDYANTVKSDTRDFLARFMLNGSEVNCDIQRVEFTTGSCADINQFTIGSVIGCSVNAEVLNLTDDVKNQVLDLQIGLLINSVYKWIKVGQYKISEVKKKINGATLTGYGKVVSDSSGNFIEPATKTLKNIGDEIASEIGGTVYFSSSIDKTKIITASMSGLTTYQAIQVVAASIGGYAVDRLDGGVNFLVYDDTPTCSVNSGMMVTLPDLEEQDFEITGMRCIVTESSTDGETPEEAYEQGNTINLIYSSKYVTQDLFTQSANNLIGYTYRPGSINLSLGDPRLIFGDVLEVTDADGSIYTVPCHSIRHIYDGGLRSEIQAATATHLENNIGTITPSQDYQKNTDKQMVQLESDIEDLANGIQYFWHDDEGAHVCTIGEYHYNHMAYNEVCLEVLITSSSIIFRHVRQGLSTSTKVYTVYATYANTGITLGDYASMTSSGILLGDINDTEYQLQLNPTQGLLLNGMPIIISDYATQSVSERTTTTRIVAGFINSDSTTLTFTVPIECIVPEGTAITISELNANFKIDGTSYFIDGAYFSGGYTWMNNYNVTAQVAGTAITVTVTKKSGTFKKHGTSTTVDAYSSITCEITKITWTTSISRSSKKSNDEEETKPIDPPTINER